MTSSGSQTEAGPIEQLAAGWAVRLGAGAPAAAEQQRLDDWLAADPRHLGALVKARAQWNDFDRLGAMAGSHAPRPVMPARERVVRGRESGELWTRRSLIAASLGGASLLGLGWSMLAPADEYYTSAVGEVRRIPLEDGSTLVLNTDSRARVHFSRERREVRLLQGEALFEVARDVHRPFIVQSADWQVRAVGTVFGVRLRGTEVDVTVSEGVVELGQSGAAREAPRRIAASEQSILAPAQPIRVEKLQEAALERRFAWLNGMVAFSGEPLADAVAEINRHNRRQIVIDDAELATQPVVGAFRATDSEAFAAAAAAALGAQSVAEDDALHLRPPVRADIQQARWGK
jgi:transmembrane sensor